MHRCLLRRGARRRLSPAGPRPAAPSQSGQLFENPDPSRAASGTRASGRGDLGGRARSPGDARAPRASGAAVAPPGTRPRSTPAPDRRRGTGRTRADTRGSAPRDSRRSWRPSSDARENLLPTRDTGTLLALSAPCPALGRGSRLPPGPSLSPGPRPVDLWRRSSPVHFSASTRPRPPWCQAAVLSTRGSKRVGSWMPSTLRRTLTTSLAAPPPRETRRGPSARC